MAASWEKELLSPKLAAEMFGKDPDSIVVRLDDVLRIYSLTLADVMLDLTSGKLAAHVDEVDGSIWLRGMAIVRWLRTRPELTKVH